MTHQRSLYYGLTFMVGVAIGGCRSPNDDTTTTSGESASDSTGGNSSSTNVDLNSLRCSDFSGISATDACDMNAKVRCGLGEQYYFASKDDCNSTVRALCMEELTLKGYNRLPAYVALEATAYSTLSPDSPRTALISANMAILRAWTDPSCGTWFGTLKNGDACVDGGQCASDSCGRTETGTCNTCVACTESNEHCVCDTSTGTCTAPSAAVEGESCDEQHVCVYPNFCDETTRTCVKQGHVGAPCTKLDFCDTNLYCDTSNHCAERLTVGTTCSDDYDCVSGFCMNGSCMDGALEGQDCVVDDRTEDDGDARNNCIGIGGLSKPMTCSPSSQLCKAYPIANESCADITSCGNGSACGADNICHPMAALGEPCDVSNKFNACEAWLVCDDGVCTTYTALLSVCQ